MKTKKTSILFLGSLLLSSLSLADVHYSASVVGRTKPATINPTGMVAYDGLLWGEYSKESPLYGYYRIGARAGGNPSYGALLQVAPIAPLIFEIQKGYTHRFAKISTIDCNTVECKGQIDRTDYSVRLIAAKNNFILLSSATWREIRTPDGSLPVGLESEVFVVSPGFHRFFETSFTFGYQLPENQLVGVMVNNGVISEGSRKSSSVYAIYRSKWDEYNYAVGAGTYKSDAPDQDGLSALFSISRSWGDKLSLF